MKSIYKILILGMVCLLSTNTFAQFQTEHAPDQINNPKRTGKNIFDCICNYEDDFLRFRNILAQIEAEKKAKWLADQQAIQKKEIERRLGKRTPYPDFRSAQKDFFEKHVFKDISDFYLDTAKKRYNKIANEAKSKVEQKRIEINTLEHRKNTHDALAQFTFGDLKSNGLLIKDMNSATVFLNQNVIAGELNNIYKPAAIEATRISDGLIRVGNNGNLIDKIVDLALSRFDSFNVEDKVTVMTKYLIARSQRIDDHGLLYLTEPKMYNPREHNQEQIAIDYANRIGNPDPLTPPTEEGVSAVLLHAIANINEESYRYARNKEAFKQEIKEYFNFHNFSERALNMLRRVVPPFLNNENFSASPSELSSVAISPTYQDENTKELALSWRADGYEIHETPNAFSGLGNVMAELYDNQPENFALEGNTIRQMFQANGMSVPNSYPYTDENLGRVFDFNKTPHGGKPGDNFYYRYEIIFKPTMGRIIWSSNVRMSTIFTNPLYMNHAVAASNGTTSDLGFEIILLELSDKLGLTRGQVDYLRTRREFTKKIREFLWYSRSDEVKPVVVDLINTSMGGFLEKIQEGTLLGLMRENLSTEDSFDATQMTLAVIRANRFSGPYDRSYYEAINPYTDLDFIGTGLFPQATAWFTKQVASEMYHLYMKQGSGDFGKGEEWCNGRVFECNTIVFWRASKEMIHLTLDGLGLIPGGGILADLFNGALYSIDGEGLNASLSFISAIPLLGWFSTGSKYSVRFYNVVGRYTTLKWIVDGSGKVSFGRSGQLAKVMRGLVQVGEHAHHIIPFGERFHELVQQAAKAVESFHINELLNGIPIEAFRNTTHPTYNTAVKNAMQRIWDGVDGVVTNPSKAYNELIKLKDQIKQIIIDNPTIKMQDLAGLIDELVQF